MQIKHIQAYTNTQKHVYIYTLWVESEKNTCYILGFFNGDNVGEECKQE